MEGYISWGVLTLLGVIGYLVKLLITEHKQTRSEIVAVLTSQAEDRVRFATIAESIIDLKKSDEKITQQLSDAITRLIVIEERQAGPVKAITNRRKA